MSSAASGAVVRLAPHGSCQCTMADDVCAWSPPSTRAMAVIVYCRDAATGCRRHTSTLLKPTYRSRGSRPIRPTSLCPASTARSCRSTTVLAGYVYSPGRKSERVGSTTTRAVARSRRSMGQCSETAVGRVRRALRVCAWASWPSSSSSGSCVRASGSSGGTIKSCRRSRTRRSSRRRSGWSLMATEVRAACCSTVTTMSGCNDAAAPAMALRGAFAGRAEGRKSPQAVMAAASSGARSGATAVVSAGRAAVKARTGTTGSTGKGKNSTTDGARSSGGRRSWAVILCTVTFTASLCLAWVSSSARLWMCRPTCEAGPVSSCTPTWRRCSCKCSVVGNCVVGDGSLGTVAGAVGSVGAAAGS
eukprot:Unigene8696_Nuclearia_a/m.26618 Unigene8696_Nuclearia_a/g.26618  ORF Unigene8696_Nuclearia_a/g.26618 Unigene8696_Nuclearia_a/m.26618 type:complete len:361 (-) Unigene8696_Nuclearia_a:809-1891(-)